MERAEQEDPPVRRGAEICCLQSSAAESCKLAVGTLPVVVFVKRLQRNIKMGGNISQRKGNGRAGSKNHSNGVT